MAASVQLATVADAKTHIQAESLSVAADAQISALIDAASEMIETKCGRSFLVVSGKVEYRDVGRGQRVFRLDSLPITAVNVLKLAYDWDYAGADAFDADEYRISGDGSALYLRDRPLFSGPDALMVDYDGGLVADTAAVKANEGGLFAACLQLVDLLWTRRSDLLKSGEGGQGWSIQREAVRIPTATLELLRPYRATGTLW